MTTRGDGTCWALTEKEKQTLRLIVRGHDAKSIARSLDLSVHTINERLRDARRKMAVSSSREAARLLLEAEEADARSAHPDSAGDIKIGEDAGHSVADRGSAPTIGAGWAVRPFRILAGVLLMSLAVVLLALAGSQLAPAPQVAAVSQAAPDREVVEAAREWLALLDDGRWEESYRATGTSFRRLNTVEMWARASERARVPLGAMLSRTFVSQENLPAPPAGYEVVKFRTRFAKGEALETVTLDREGELWRVVGVTVG